MWSSFPFRRRPCRRIPRTPASRAASSINTLCESASRKRAHVSHFRGRMPNPIPMHVRQPNQRPPSGVQSLVLPRSEPSVACNSTSPCPGPASPSPSRSRRPRAPALRASETRSTTRRASCARPRPPAPRAPDRRAWRPAQNRPFVAACVKHSARSARDPDAPSRQFAKDIGHHLTVRADDKADQPGLRPHSPVTMHRRSGLSRSFVLLSRASSGSWPAIRPRPPRRLRRPRPRLHPRQASSAGSTQPSWTRAVIIRCLRFFQAHVELLENAFVLDTLAIRPWSSRRPVPSRRRWRILPAS